MPPRLPLLIEVAARDLRLDIPRRCDAPDFLTLSVAAAAAVLPASPQRAEAMMPDMEKCSL